MRRAVARALKEKTKTTVPAFFGDECFFRTTGNWWFPATRTRRFLTDSLSRPSLLGVVDAKNDDDAFSRAGLRVSSPCSWSGKEDARVPRENVVAGRNVGRGVVCEEEVAELPGYAPPGVDVVLMAVPKAKVTPSRKKRRNQFKKVEFVRDARKCPTCRKPMRSWHNFCCPPKDEKEDVVYSTTE